VILGVTPTQVQDSALGLVEPHVVHIGPLLRLVQVSLDGIMSLRCVSRTTQIGVTCKLAADYKKETLLLWCLSCVQSQMVLFDHSC